MGLVLFLLAAFALIACIGLVALYVAAIVTLAVVVIAYGGSLMFFLFLLGEEQWGWAILAALVTGTFILHLIGVNLNENNDRS
ncbi:MAG: hypothetical protein KF778_00490 [Rhodocyclaceae bacterium]|nr:hypothetical protein [Rhodocyclaceae bacterium]MBX3666858.1 hypothetical protein [Rhodocyclaceae bacterium]